MFINILALLNIVIHISNIKKKKMKAKQYKFKISFDIILGFVNPEIFHYDLITKYCLDSSDFNQLINIYLTNYDRNSIGDPVEAVSFLENIKMMRSIDLEKNSINTLDLAIYLINLRDYPVMSLSNIHLQTFKIH